MGRQGIGRMSKLIISRANYTAPKSFIHLLYLCKNSVLTDFEMFFSAILKWAIVNGTSICDWRLAMSSMLVCSRRRLRKGMREASRQTLAMSAPLYPSVLLTRIVQSMSESSFICLRLISKSFSRPFSEGRAISREWETACTDPFLQPTNQGLVEVPGTVGGGDDDDSFLFFVLVLLLIGASTGGLGDAIHLDEHLTLDASTGLMGPFFTATEHRIDLVKEEGGGAVEAGHFKEQLPFKAPRTRTIFSDSPRHFEARLAADTLKKVVFPVVAIAFASIVLPVPGGPKRRTPFQGLRIP